MSREYEYAESIEKKFIGHLKSLGFNIHKPPFKMSVKRKLSILNYLRTISTASDLLQNAVNDIPIDTKDSYENGT